MQNKIKATKEEKENILRISSINLDDCLSSDLIQKEIKKHFVDEFLEDLEIQAYEDKNGKININAYLCGDQIFSIKNIEIEKDEY